MNNIAYQPYGGYNQDYNGGDYNNTSGGFDSNGGGSQGTRTQTKNSLTPVTIKQINDSKPIIQDGEFIVHNLELNLVSFIGVIRKVTDNASNLQVQLEDGTGSIELRKWVDENAHDESNAFLQDGKYVYVTGSVKEFGGKKNIQHTTFREITDFNEVLYHHLSAIDCHLKAQGVKSETKPNESSNGLFVSGPAESEGGLSVADKIYEFINENTPSMPEGVPVQLIAQNLNLLVDDVVLHCGKLTEDAKIYAGYDENGFLAV
ncbi:hypothetical protein WICANDRAFT_33850 [Wickerhamomyces anomalus NRRL Y-366-8]|uniref:Replication protein A C-terminal domain-containing protein n=1 Tax=Wickerhamomyces anomalus (strain ATCC 58044 / CBS 1984 / NCYC 433 / NRRL Y-366-8) TaxID=683960 RepID=A0A1E3NZ20_WICAA|nr:uncharacterized protein WICANDRAFT_33850 [Wickerhamomyces anomalus NRRL Y-366-8]ODQ58471.1 hypothetical protein WICANDRAFT_33850 [Wickerhamomyces anomalus NRRL Y-366-8]